MKSILFILTTCIALSASAQDKGNELPHWCAELNFMSGGLKQTLSNTSYTNTYPAALNAVISKLKTTSVSSVGGDVQIAYFVGAKRHFGFSTGIVFSQQHTNIQVDKYHIEYRALDYNNDTFRQVLTSNGPIKEKITSTGINIPLLLKYQTQLSKKTGLMLDAGLLLNMSISSTYTANASFDYEAIYKLGLASDGARFVYDDAAIPSQSDWMIIGKQYTAAKMDELRARGYNVGLIKKADQGTAGTVAYKSGSIGWLIRPAISYRLSERLFLQGGLNLMMQTFTQDAATNYTTTGKVGEYNTLLKSVTKSENISYGANLGLRFFFGNSKDSDGDGIADKKDKCPLVAGLRQFNGCPDTDGDGIPDPDDSCRKLAGIELYHGCPDTDGDGIPDNRDACPHAKGPAKFNGCPDTDDDGIPDSKDECPDVAGTPAAHGCPDRDNDGVADKNDDCPEIAGSTQNYGCPYDSSVKDQVHGHALPTHTLLKKNTINYSSGQSVIDPSSLSVIDEAVDALNKDPRIIILISGYTDDIGSDVTNILLSIARAESVNKYLLSKGIPEKRIVTSGYGKKSPIVENNSAGNRAKNRRIEMKLLLPIE